ncbi:LysR family transcriptional regulator [Amycolatopsis jiangsuensis]|uniref:DNA-binding transcriptional LysR family regulator n=1 Tax=Amycolatopsis jiangsuensis TaxID=1181879 RepID=A0A840J008_9PSEU|nr:LysR family transcriptional regulator [Amycolatopsis jiangsuensis]MBB4686782.1 DNA-binding transcriptional LysR family regulator [Amycolatopsis jiangsuensis]
MDLDLRLVRYFTVVAEHLNFGRAATALHLAQPSLSRQIQRLEDQLGVRLFDRTPQGSRLTEAGRVFLPRAQELLGAARESALAVRAVAPSRTITIGYIADLVITPAVRELRRRYPDARIRTRHLDWQETSALPEHEVDALVARMPLPLPSDRFQVRVLYEEPRVLVMSPAHRLAGKESVALDDLDEELEACAGSPAIWSVPRPLGPARVSAGPSGEDSFEDKVELVAEGHSILILPRGDGRTTLREDLVTVPLDGIDPCQVVLATHTGDRNPLVTAFREIAGTHLGAG